MSTDSRLPGFYRRTVAERVDLLVERGVIGDAEARALKSGKPLLPVNRADHMIENVIGTFGLPFAVAGNFRVDDRDFLVPMVVEEPSIVAGLSGAAKLARHGGGFRTESAESLLAGQVHLVGLDDADAALAAITKASGDLLARANARLARLVDRGGGAREVSARRIDLDGEAAVCVHIYVDTRDAMGANLVNSVCEGIAPLLEALTGGRAVMKILSNLVDRSIVVSRVRIPLKALRGTDFAPEAVRDAIVLATELAHADPWRAATHNKGVMNGIDAVAIATGNDWRAIEAAAHAWAARDGAYRSLTDWQVGDDGALEGRIEIPLKPGIVGGSLEANPGVRLGLAIAGVGTARDLAGLMASVGLAQNFAALRALVTHGIQRGHMQLHARSVASAADVPDEVFDEVVDALIESGDIKIWKAKELLEEYADDAWDVSSVSGATGVGHAAGKVILLGEHAAVYDKHVLALPLPDAMRVEVIASRDHHRFVLVDRGRSVAVDASTRAGSGMADVVDLIGGRLGIDGVYTVRVESRIPPGMGLGASAAFAVATIRALADLHDLDIDDDAVNALAYDCERLAHGTPSGIDNTLATYAQPVSYRRSMKPAMTSIELPDDLPLVVASSGRIGATIEQVAAVRERRERQPAVYDGIFEQIDGLSLAGAEALRRGDVDALGELMNVCQGLLNAIGVSTPDLESMIGIARSAGAVGAKLTGAGGGGSIVALCPGTRELVADALAAAGYDVITTWND